MNAVRIECPLEGKLEKLGEIMMEFVKVLEKVDLKLENFNMRLADTIERLNVLEEMIGGSHAEIQIHDTDKREEHTDAGLS